MANKKLPKKKTKNHKAAIHSSFHSPWIIGLLLITLIIVTILGTIGINNLEANTRTKLDIARLEVFDDIARSYISEYGIREPEQTHQEMTGYGISNEDGVFYITFNYYLIKDDHTVDTTAHPAILYFWKDEERNTFSHAFSYPDDPAYHPDGIYVKK